MTGVKRQLIPRNRDYLLCKAARIYFDHSDKFMDVTLRNILLRRYKAESTYDLTLNDLEDLIRYMEDKVRKASMI